MEVKGNLIILTFDRYENKEELNDALNATNYKIALIEIAEKIFRPNRKYGYSDETLMKLRESNEVAEAIDILENMFFDILNERKIELYE